MISTWRSCLPASRPADQLAQGRFAVVQLLFDDQLQLAVLVDRELDVPVPDVHEPRVVIDQSVAREESPVFAVSRAVNPDAALIVDQRGSDRRTTRARSFFVERDDDLQPLPFVHVQRQNPAGAGFTDLYGPPLPGRLQHVRNLRAAIVHDPQVGIAVAGRGVDVAVEGNAQDLLDGRGAPIQVLPISERRFPIRGCCRDRSESPRQNITASRPVMA